MTPLAPLLAVHKKAHKKRERYGCAPFNATTLIPALCEPLQSTMHTLRNALWNPHTRISPLVQGFLMDDLDNSRLFLEETAYCVLAEAPLLR